MDVCCGISLRRKLDFSAKKNEFPFCRLWISSGDTAGRQSNKLLSNKKLDGITFEMWAFSLDTFNVKCICFNFFAMIGIRNSG